jgi:hypothetical protein
VEDDVLVPSPPAAAGWTVDEVHKLARVLRRERKTRLVRWRGEPGAPG